MAQLKDQLKKDLTDAIKSHNQVISGTLRMALTAIQMKKFLAKNLENYQMQKFYQF